MSTQIQTKLSRKEIILLLLLACVQFAHIMDFMIIMPLGSRLMDVWDIQPRQFGWLVSSYTFAAGFSGLLAAFRIDRFDRKAALLFLFTGFMLGTLACAFSVSYTMLIVARVVTGMFGGILAALVLSIVGDTIPLVRRATAMAIVMSAFAVATVVGVPLGLQLSIWYDWWAPFVFLSCFSLAILLLLAYYMEPIKGHMTDENRKNGPLDIMKGIYKDINQIKALSLMIFLMMGQFMVAPYIEPFMTNNVGLTAQQIIIVYLLGGLAILFCAPFIGKWSDRFGKQKVFGIMVLLSLLPLLTLSHLEGVNIYGIYTICTLFFLLGGGSVIPAMTLVTSSVSREKRGSFMSIAISVRQFAYATASLLAGYILIEAPDKTLHRYVYLTTIAVIFSLMGLYAGVKLKTKES